MSVIRCTLMLLLAVSSVLLNAQEVKYIDLSLVSQRTDLRNPPAPPVDCKEGAVCVGGGYGGGSGGDGAPDIRDPHALGVYLLYVTPTDINPAKPFEVEFKVLNTGLAPIEVPVSPHLSDLQPNDESVPFTYFSLALSVTAEFEPRRPGLNSVAFVELYGSSDHVETMSELQPGEWMCVRANVKLQSGPSEAVSARLRGGFWLHRNVFHPHAGGQFTESNGLYPNATSTSFVAVHFLPSSSGRSS